MFDIGFWELFVIAVIGLVVLGPERLPGAIRSVQRTMAKVRAFGSKVEAELNHELRVKELHEHLKQIEATDDIEKLSPELKRSLQELKDAAASVQHPYAKPAAEKTSSEAAADGDAGLEQQSVTDSQNASTSSSSSAGKSEDRS